MFLLQSPIIQVRVCLCPRNCLIFCFILPARIYRLHTQCSRRGWGRGWKRPFPHRKSSFICTSLICPKVAKNYIMSNNSTECMKQWLSPTLKSSKRRKEKEKELSHSLSFMGTKAELVCSIWRMQMPPAASLPLVLSKWPFRLNCSSQCSPIKNGQQWGKGYLLIHKRYERQGLFHRRFLFPRLGENLSSWNSSQVIYVCIYPVGCGKDKCMNVFYGTTKNQTKPKQKNQRPKSPNI